MSNTARAIASFQSDLAKMNAQRKAEQTAQNRQVVSVTGAELKDQNSPFYNPAYAGSNIDDSQVFEVNRGTGATVKRTDKDASPKMTEGGDDLFFHVAGFNKAGSPYTKDILTTKGEGVESRAEQVLPKLYQRDEQGGYAMKDTWASNLRGNIDFELDSKGDMAFLDRIAAETHPQTGKAALAKDDKVYRGDEFDLGGENVQAVKDYLDRLTYRDGALVYNPSQSDMRAGLRAFENMSKYIQHVQKGGDDTTIDGQKILDFFKKTGRDMTKEERDKLRDKMSPTQKGKDISLYKLATDKDGNYKFELSDEPMVQEYIKNSKDPSVGGIKEYLASLNTKLLTQSKQVERRYPSLIEDFKQSVGLGIPAGDEALRMLQNRAGEFNAQYGK